MINIFIANLDWSITSEDLKTTFSSFGEVSYAHVVFDKKTRRSKGFGYVEMEDKEAAIKAIESLDGMEIHGRPIDVKVASPKSNRPTEKVKPQSGSAVYDKSKSKKRDFTKNNSVKEAAPKVNRKLRPRKKKE